MNHHLPHYLYVVFFIWSHILRNVHHLFSLNCEFILLWTSLNTSYFDLFMVWSCHKRCIVLSNLVGYCTNAIKEGVVQQQRSPTFPKYRLQSLPPTLMNLPLGHLHSYELNWRFQPIFQVQLDTPCFSIFNPIFLIPRFHL